MDFLVAAQLSCFLTPQPNLKLQSFSKVVGMLPESWAILARVFHRGSVLMTGDDRSADRILHECDLVGFESS